MDYYVYIIQNNCYLLFNLRHSLALVSSHLETSYGMRAWCASASRIFPELSPLELFSLRVHQILSSIYQIKSCFHQTQKVWFIKLNRGRMDDLSFLDYLSPFCFLLIEFHCTFSISYKRLQYFVYYNIFWLGCDRLSGLFFSACFASSVLKPLFLPSSFVSLSYFILAVPMLVCLGKHSCMGSSSPIAILNSTCFFPTVQLQMYNVYSERKTRNSCALVNLYL